MGELMVRGATVRETLGCFSDDWCEAAASIRLNVPDLASSVSVAIWLMPEEGAPATARFAVQTDLNAPLVADVACGPIIWLCVPCKSLHGHAHCP